MSRHRLLALLLLLGWYLACDARYLPVWRSDLTLWRHAAALAPLKPRPQFNLAKQLFVIGADDEALRQLWAWAAQLDAHRGIW